MPPAPTTGCASHFGTCAGQAVRPTDHPSAAFPDAWNRLGGSDRPTFKQAMTIRRHGDPLRSHQHSTGRRLIVAVQAGRLSLAKRGARCATDGNPNGTHMHSGHRGKCGSQRRPTRKLRGSCSHSCECVAPVGGHCQLAGTGWVFVYSCEVGTCGYGYSFGFHHVAYGPRGATGTWYRAKVKPHDVTITFHLTSGTDSFVATLNPHTGTAPGPRRSPE